MELARLDTRSAEKKSEELKQRLLGSSLHQQARQKESELKPEAKRMPRRMNARESAPAHVSPARASAPAHVCPARASAPAHVCPFMKNARETGHICAASCLNWVMCPSTEDPIRINQIACVQGYGNSSSEEDTDMD